MNSHRSRKSLNESEKMMMSSPTQPHTSPMQSYTPDDFGMGATLPDADYSLEELNDVDFGQYLTDFDAGDNVVEGLNADLLLQYNEVTSIAPVDTITGEGSLPAAATFDKSSDVQDDGPRTSALVSEDPIASAAGHSVDNAASNTMATEADCAITPDESLSAYQSPIFENIPFLPPPLPIAWNTTPNLQPRLDSFRPVSAPPTGTYDLYNQFPPMQQYDQSLDLPGYDYPSPPSNMDSYSSDSCFGFQAPGSYSLSTTGMSPMAAHPYQQTSISYPGSPTQPIDPALMMNGFFGPPHMPRQVRQYLPPPTSSPYGAAAVFNNGRCSNAMPRMQQPPMSNPLKRALDNEVMLNPKRQRIQKWVGDTNTARGLHHSLEPLKLSLQIPGTTASATPSPVDSLNTIPSGVDITKAVTLPIRRTRNPGRKQTIKQTSSVMKRNRVRRERYRAQLPPHKRELYDFNASMAKGLISVAGGEKEEEEGEDGDEDAEYDNLDGGDVNMRDGCTDGLLVQ